MKHPGAQQSRHEIALGLYTSPCWYAGSGNIDYVPSTTGARSLSSQVPAVNLAASPVHSCVPRIRFGL
jgi:hypothetical protein